MSPRKNKVKLTLGAASLLLSLGFILSPNNAFAASNSICIQNAINNFGEEYVIFNYKAFVSRCNTASNGGNGYSSTYGMLAQANVNAPESNGKEGQFEVEAKRLIYSNAIGDMWALISVDAKYASFSEQRLSAIGTGGDRNNWIAGDSTTVSVDAEYAVSHYVIQDEVAEITVPYNSCLYGYGCNQSNLYLYFRPIANILHSNQQKVTYDETDYNDEDIITIDENPGLLEFAHQLKRDDDWHDIQTQNIPQAYKRSLYSEDTLYDEDDTWSDIELNANGDYTDITSAIDLSTLDISSEDPIKICSTVTYKDTINLIGSSESDSSEEKDSTICVQVIKASTDPSDDPDPETDPELDPPSNEEADDESDSDAPEVPNTGLITSEKDGADTANIAVAISSFVVIVLVALSVSRRLSIRSRIRKF